MIIETAIVIGVILDLTLTYNYLKIYKEKFPKKDYIIIEANPLIRWCVRSLGLKEGMFRAGFFILPTVIVIIYFASINLRFFIAGAYYMMITFHLTNFLALKRIKEVNK